MNNEQLIGLQHKLQAEQSINSSCRVTLETSSPEIKVLESEISRVKSVLDNIDLQLNTKNFNIGENMETLNNKQKYYSNELNNLIVKKDENVNELLDNINSIINNSDLSSYLSDIMEKYNSILSTLSLDQTVALFNILGFFMILVTIFNLTTVFIGDYLIDRLKLENKYPKLTKYIKFKQNLNKGYLTFYYVILYIITIIFILCNIYMIFLKYLI
jgi:hypothetical protein